MPFYVFGAALTIFGLLAFKLTDNSDARYAKLVHIQPSKGYKNYVRLRKAFLLISGLIMVILSIYIDPS